MGNRKKSLIDKRKGTLDDLFKEKKLNNPERQTTQNEVKRDEVIQANNTTEFVTEITTENTVAAVEEVHDQADNKLDQEERVQIILEEAVYKLRSNNYKIESKNNKIRYFFLTLVLFLVGFLMGQYYEISTWNTVYILNEAKFLKLASIGIATSDKDRTTTDLSPSDKDKVKTAISEVNKILATQYNKYPVLIQKRDKSGYDFYNTARRIDITIPLIKKLIGEDKWEEIGKALK